MKRFYLFLVFVFVSLITNAQTITISQETGGVSTSPLASGATDVAIMGILFDKSTGGACELDAITVDLSTAPTGIFTNPRLYRSTNNIFEGIGSENLVSTGSIVGSTFVFDETPTFITDFNNSTGQVDRFIFVVVDIVAGLNASTPSIQPSLVDTNVTSAGCTINAGTVTGTDFSFLGLTIGSLNAGANNVAGSPLIAGAAGQAVFGFSLTSNGSQTVSVANVQLSTDPATKLSSYSLVRSVDADFATTGDNTTIGGLTFTPSATQVAITGLSESITSTASNYFLVANVNPAVTGATTNIQASLVAANITVSTGGKEGSSTGTDYGFTTATTTIASLNAGANNVATSPITAGATGRAVFGFSLTSNGSQTATALNIQFTTDPTASKYTNYSLVKSVDANFASSGDNSTVGGLTFTPSATEVVITGLSQALSSTSSNYFLVVDVNAAATGNIQASLGSTNITLGAGSGAGSSTGINYSFAPLTTTIASLNAGANNVATSPITAGATGQAVFGFSLTSNGSQTATALNIQFTADPTASKYTNYSLVKSVDANFASSGDNSTVGGLTFTPSATEVVITGLSQALSSTSSNYFLVVDVNAAATGNIQASLGSTNVTLGTGSATGSATGTNYGFAPLTATIGSLNAGANNVATSPIVTGGTGKAVFGFSLTSNGLQTATAVNIQLSSTPVGKYSNYSLVKSTDADFATSGNNTPVAGLTFTPSATQVAITGLTEALSGVPSNYFLVIDVDPAATGNIQASLANTNVTVGTGTVAGSSTGTNYSFAPLTATITSLNAGANNVALSPLEAGTSGRGIFGFALASNGLQTVSVINVQLSANPAGKWSSFSLVSSTDADFGTSGNNTIVPTSSINVTGVAPFEVQITPTTPIDISSAKNLFLIANVNPSLTSASSPIQASLGTANFTVNAGVKAGSATGTNYSFNSSQSTTITVDYDGQVGPGFIDIGDYSKQSSTGLTTGNSEKIFGISINDSDPDSHGTTVTSLTVQLSNFSNLNAIALFDGSTQVPGTELDIASNIIGNQITFSPINIAVGDNSSKIIDVYVTFAPTVTDNQFITAAITGAVANTTGSGLATLGTIQTDPAKNKINVVATEMQFTAITPGIIPAMDFGLTVLATDNLGNQDFNTTGNVVLSKQSGPGTLSSTDAGGLTRTFSSGSVSWSQLELTLAGDYTIRANHSGSLPNKDEPITVTSLGVQITGPTNQNFCIGGAYAPLNTITITEADPADFKVGTGVTYSFILPPGFEFNTAVTPTPSETGSNVNNLSAINYPTNSIARFSYNVSAENSSDAIIISGLQIRYVGTMDVTNQEIHRIGGSAYQEGNNDTDGNIHGTLDASTASDPPGFTFNVSALPGDPAITPTTTSFSETGNNVALDGTPAGGDFSGNGVAFTVANGYIFSPSAAGPGSHLITYTYQDPVAPNCISTTEKTFNVSSANIIQNLLTVYCKNSTPSTGLSVSNTQRDFDFPPNAVLPFFNFTYVVVDYYYSSCNIFFGCGIYQPIPGVNTTFDPSNPIYGTSPFSSVSVKYRVQEYNFGVPTGNFYLSPSDQVVNINPLPFVTANINDADLQFCVGDAPVDLIGSPTPSNLVANDFFTASPFPGSVANAGGNTWRFDPSAVTVGASPVNVSITYTYQNPSTGCSNTSAPIIVTVNPIPSAPTGILASNDLNFCQNSPITGFSAPASPGITYRWYSDPGLLTQVGQGNNFNPVINNTIIGTTNFYVTQTNNTAQCESPATPLSVTIHQPATVDAGDFGLGICFNEKIVFTDFDTPASIGGSVSNGSWNDLGGGGQFFDITEINPDNTFSSSRVYQPTIAQYNSGIITLELTSETPSSITPTNPCPSVSDQVQILVKPAPGAPNLSQPDPYCVGDPVENLTAVGTNLKWYTDPSLMNQFGSGNSVLPSGVTGNSPSNDDFYVTQSLTGCEGPPSIVNVTYNATPVADFSVVNQCLGEEMELSSIPESTISSGSIVKWGWQFGDGDNVLIPNMPVAASDIIPSSETGPQTSGTYSQPKHFFSTSGDYNMRLTVISDLGCQNSISKVVTVDPIPKTDFSFRNLCDGEITEFQFDAGVGFPTGKLNLWEWNFGDPASGGSNIISGNGSNPSDRNPLHQFSSVDSYSVSLRLSTGLGCEATKTKTVSVLPFVTTFPYRESFEQLNHGWAAESFTSETDLSWQWTSPSSNTINSASDGINVWFVHDNVSGQYFNDERSVLNGPCFDMTQLQRPVVSFDYWSNTETKKDGVYVEVSTDGGVTWDVLGDTDEGLNWYNQDAILGLSEKSGIGQTIEQIGWSGNSQTGSESNGWTPAKYSMDSYTNENKLRIRYVFGSNADNPSGVDGFAMDDFAIESRNRTLLAENFTNNAATGAAANSTAFQSFNNGASFNELVKIQYHTSIGGNDPLYLSNPAAPNARAAFYGVTNSFQGYIDGQSEGTFAQAWADPSYDSRTLVASPIEIDISSPVTPSELFNIEANIAAIDDLDPGQYAVHIAIVEKQVGSEAFVLRKMLPDAAGTPLTAITNGAVQTVTVSTELTNIADPNEIAVVVFVQQMNGQKEVLQAGLLDGIPTPPIVTGLEYKQFGDLISFYPNPADEEFTILLPSAARQDVPVRLADPVGKVVYDDVIAVGEKAKTINTRNLTGGIYLLQIENGKENVAYRKVMVVHNK